jgi:tetratricopeptide (TPR) repeat protein
MHFSPPRCLLLCLLLASAFAAASRLSLAQRHQDKDAQLAKFIHAGIADARAGRYQQAISEYQQALVIDPHCMPAQINLGLAWFKSGNFEKAIPPLESAAQEGADSDQVHTLLAMSYYPLHRYAEAGRQFEVLYERKPDNTTVQYLLAESYMRSHQTGELPGLVQRLYAVSPDSPVVHMIAGEQYDRLDRTVDAIREFQLAEAHAADMPLVHFSLGYFYWEQHHLPEAAREFQLEADLKNGEAAQATGFLGDIALKNGNRAEAETLLRKSVQLENDVRIAHYDLGVICAEKKQGAEAVEHFQAAIALDPKSVDAYYQLAMVYRQLGQTDQQRTLLAKVSQMHAEERQSVVNTISREP